MLKTILIVTISALNLAAVESAYEEFFNYQVAESGVVSAELADVWNAPAMTGKRYVLMQPDNGAEVYIRFIENAPVEGYEALTSTGWNATELLVQNPDALAAAMSDGPFTVTGAPADLWDAPGAPRAMQAIGPANEVLYLTRNGDFATTTAVDRVFIMVLGGTSLDALSDFYGDRLGLGLGDQMQLPVPFMAEAQGVAADTMYDLRVAILSRDFLLELDEYPASVSARPVKPGHLPPGTSMVSFETDSLDALDVAWRATPAAIDPFPYNGRRVGITQGPAGEWLEIIETGTSQ